MNETAGSRTSQAEAPAQHSPRTARCAVCGGSNVYSAFQVKATDSADRRFSVLRCADCGLGWTDPPVPDSELEHWYPPPYYGNGKPRFKYFIETMVRFLGRCRARTIARLSASGPVLDVGCGHGGTLSALRSLGYDPFGVELSETAAWHAKQRHKINVHVGDFVSAPYSAGQFNVIVFWHSLEHFSRPVEAVRHAHKLLKPGGLLVVAVPNSESFQARCFGPHWFHLDIPRHYFHFGTRNLHALLTSTGFRISKTSHLSLEQSPYGWLQTIYNAMGFEVNLLYSILKKRTARPIPIRRYPFQVLITLTLFPILLPLSILMTIVEAVCRRGGTVDVYAIK